MADIDELMCEEYPLCGLSQWSCDALQNIVYESDASKRRDIALKIRQDMAKATKALIANERREAKAEAKAELRAKFGIEADKQYDVKIGNGVIVAQLSTPPKKEETDK